MDCQSDVHPALVFICLNLLRVRCRRHVRQARHVIMIDCEARQAPALSYAAQSRSRSLHLFTIITECYLSRLLSRTQQTET
jgi:hypothetical protein